MLEKPCIMFHVLYVGENIYHISYQYHEYKFIKYPELIYFLRVVEQNNELSLKNHQSHLTHSTPFPIANEKSFDNHEGNYGRGCGCGCGCGCGYGYGCGRNNQYRQSPTHNSSKRNKTPYHQKIKMK